MMTEPSGELEIKSSDIQVARSERQGSWAKDMSGRRVDFPSDEGLAWGIELTIPLLDPAMRNALESHNIDLPKHVDTLIYLDVSPQESLPQSLRNIRTKRSPLMRTELSKMASKTVGSPAAEKFTEAFNAPRPSDILRSEQVVKFIEEVFGGDQKAKETFNKYAADHKANNLVIVHGHGGEGLEIGEQYYNDATVAPDGTPIQKHGNAIHINEILERYNDPEKYTAVLLHNCHDSNEKVEAKNIPVFMPIGDVGGAASVMRLNSTQVSVPNM